MAEQPGAMPEIGPSPDFAANVSQPFNERSSLNQAWLGYPVRVQLGLVPPSEALPALKLRQTSCYSGTYGLYVEGGPGCDPGTYTGHTQQAYTLNTGVMAVGLGNYGQLGP